MNTKQSKHVSNRRYVLPRLSTCEIAFDIFHKKEQLEDFEYTVTVDDLIFMQTRRTFKDNSYIVYDENDMMLFFGGKCDSYHGGF